MRFACIARHRGEYPVRLMCRVLSVSVAGFYAWLTRAPSARAIADERLMLNIRVSHERSEGTYGAPRVQRDLRADDGDRGTPASPRAAAPLRPWEPVRLRRVPRLAGRPRDARQHEPERQLLGQRGRGELLRDARAGVDRQACLAHTRRGAPGDLSLRRDPVQPRAAALDARLHQPGAVRTAVAVDSLTSLIPPSTKSG